WPSHVRSARASVPFAPRVECARSPTQRRTGARTIRPGARIVKQFRRATFHFTFAKSRPEWSHGSGMNSFMEIELVRGTRRRKHVEAVLVGDRLRVSFPRWMSLAEAQQTA